MRARFSQTTRTALCKCRTQEDALQPFVALLRQCDEPRVREAGVVHVQQLVAGSPQLGSGWRTLLEVRGRPWLQVCSYVLWPMRSFLMCFLALVLFHWRLVLGSWLSCAPHGQKHECAGCGCMHRVLAGPARASFLSTPTTPARGCAKCRHVCKGAQALTPHSCAQVCS